MHSTEPLFDAYLSAALAGRRAEALALLCGALERGMEPRTLLRRVVQAAQHRVGDLWERNEIGFAEEHLATAIAQVAASHLYAHCTPPEPNGFSVLLACVEGDQHGFPARLAADALELAGFTVQFVGPGLSTEDLCSLVQERRPDVVGLSATLLQHRPALRSALLAVREVAPSTVRMAGGHAASPALQSGDPELLVAPGSADGLVDAVLDRLHHKQPAVAR